MYTMFIHMMATSVGLQNPAKEKINSVSRYIHPADKELRIMDMIAITVFAVPLGLTKRKTSKKANPQHSVNRLKVPANNPDTISMIP